MRYVVVAGSESGHCCFDWSVCDTTRPLIIGGKHYERDGQLRYEQVCECFEEADAQQIAAALNITTADKSTPRAE